MWRLDATRASFEKLETGDRVTIVVWRRLRLAISLPRPKPPTIGRASPGGAILWYMKVEEIAEAVAGLPPDQLARFRRWFTAFEAGRTDHAEELDSTATKLGRLAGRAFAELKKRAKER